MKKSTTKLNKNTKHRVIELFAGVGGFRLGLEKAGWDVIWSNQWEPSTKRQHACEVYSSRFSDDSLVCEDITKILDEVEAGNYELPDHELLVGGFPCQDYSVARVLNQAVGLVGKKGVLWWQIYRILKLKKPKWVFLENVDRLLKSPAPQRGRDFAIMLSCMNDLGYSVEWRVINAAEYGFAQRRRRTFIVGYLQSEILKSNPRDIVYNEGILANAFPVIPPNGQLSMSSITTEVPILKLNGDISEISDKFGKGLDKSPFLKAGYCSNRSVWTYDVNPSYEGVFTTLGDILQVHEHIPESFYVSQDSLEKWVYLKGAKKEKRTVRNGDFSYYYNEGPLPFPDPVDRPSRTILTGEGGTTPSRFKHIIATQDGRYRRLTPIELERLNGFPDDWTGIPNLTDDRRAFLMGNALVVGLIEKVGKVLREATI
jgi:DNA (cytosine-5)-methyltransferase 1